MKAFNSLIHGVALSEEMPMVVPLRVTGKTIRSRVGQLDDPGVAWKDQ